ncbi:leucine zipper domain-containing protein, partial [Xanthomonas chitinilytica]|uniref:leucine zipper domain-containing protein n=1 Tax=Xanthomonas chitinilytica TaxID=2989819 RepID=UPI0022367817
MNLHKHARLTPRGRALLVDRVIEQGLRVEEAAHAAGVSVRTAYKWLRRFREEGLSGLQDRSSRPQSSPCATPSAMVEQVLALRHQRKTYRQIALVLPVGLSTIARLMRRAGLHRLAELEPARPDNRYEYPQAGDLLHLDIKKLGRFWRPGHRVTGDRQGASDGAGWEFVHLAIDDHSRVAFGTIEGNERGSSACRALMQALRYYRSLGVTFRRV